MHRIIRFQSRFSNLIKFKFSTESVQNNKQYCFCYNQKKFTEYLENQKLNNNYQEYNNLYLEWIKKYNLCLIDKNKYKGKKFKNILIIRLFGRIFGLGLLLLF